MFLDKVLHLQVQYLEFHISILLLQLEVLEQPYYNPRNMLMLAFVHQQYYPNNKVILLKEVW